MLAEADGGIFAVPQVVRAFAAIGWEWGGTWSEPDFQHFSASGRAATGRSPQGP